MYDGIINVYKEKGYTSHDVVAKMRGILGQKKVGHTGTLDPEAEGVLLVCAGKGTRLCDMLTDTDKTYRAVLLLGVETDTEDMTGTVLRTADVSGLTEEEIKRMRDEAKANEARDKEERERVDKLNAADAQVFASEKNLKEYGDKISADKKSAIESATNKLKEAHKAGNIAELDKLTDELNKAWQAASADIQNAANAGAQQGGAGSQSSQNSNSGTSNNGGKDGEVTDVDFEEVK